MQFVGNWWDYSHLEPLKLTLTFQGYFKQLTFLQVDKTWFFYPASCHAAMQEQLSTNISEPLTSIHKMGSEQFEASPQFLVFIQKVTQARPHHTNSHHRTIGKRVGLKCKLKD